MMILPIKRHYLGQSQRKLWLIRIVFEANYQMRTRPSRY